MIYLVYIKSAILLFFADVTTLTFRYHHLNVENYLENEINSTLVIGFSVIT